MADGFAFEHLRLGVNIDHVATIRNARGGAHPDPVRAAKIAENAGADGITVHLREDRRHILDEDLARLSVELQTPLNLEMAATAEMQSIALRWKPNAVCLVPERREERTTEGGLNVVADQNRLRDFTGPLKQEGCRISLFIEADERQIEAATRIGADIVELHTGTYCEAVGAGEVATVASELKKLQKGAALALQAGLEPHAGHGLSYDSVGPIASIPELAELNIGHFLIGEAVFIGLEAAVVEMRSLMDDARAPAEATGS